ncbi:hypothetical protein [Radiobacillus deserti]|uniref:Uncharacterized protein n=1 Tax=Radiobacillus deserti TaxID=2594883 RepID=A0A516KIZ3_9BACI|nr:hypothetical protein [Radiobacillus deserti]QDP41365.1 hypothetical protein FN924_14935 [Radiobacillus deserti]
MSISRILKFATGLCEAVLGIPFLGAAIILGNLWTPLGFMLVFHIITLLFTKRDGGSTFGSVLGIITSLIGGIPFVGMVMHIITAIVLLFQAVLPER